MSKELTPLEALDKIKQAEYFVDFELDAKVSEDYKKELNIIETALKDYENLQLKHRSMTEQVFNDFKKLKALEIIKDFLYIDDENTLRLRHGAIVNLVGITFSDREVIDLLKEVLNYGD